MALTDEEKTWLDQIWSIDRAPEAIRTSKAFMLAAVEKEEYVEDLIKLAGAISDPSGLNDKVWAKEVYVKAIEKAENDDDFKVLAGAIADPDGPNDKVWAKELYKKSETITKPSRLCNANIKI